MQQFGKPTGVLQIKLEILLTEILNLSVFVCVCKYMMVITETVCVFVLVLAW